MIRRPKKGAVSYGRVMAMFPEPTRRKMLFKIRIENFQGQKAYTTTLSNGNLGAENGYS